MASDTKVHRCSDCGAWTMSKTDLCKWCEELERDYS